jgi:hypothetical protein
VAPRSSRRARNVIADVAEIYIRGRPLDFVCDGDVDDRQRLAVRFIPRPVDLLLPLDPVSDALLL